MANMNVTYADIERTVSDLKNGEQQLLDLLNQLKGKVDGLVSSGFVTDRASGAFKVSYEEFTNGASKTVRGLDGVTNFLSAAQKSMAELDQSLANALNR